MTVLITGITGFIGSHLGRRLVGEGREVVGIVRPGASLERIHDYAERVRLIEGDLTAPDTYRRKLIDARPEWAFHLAWYGKPGRFWNGVENLESASMTSTLARILASSGCRQILVAGSAAEYDYQHGYLSESRTPCEPASLYGVSKNATRVMLEAYAPLADVTVGWARFFAPFGPDEGTGRWVPRVIRSFLAGERAACPAGDLIRDFVYVEDCVGALLAMADAGASGPINVGTGDPVRVRTVVELLAELTGRQVGDADFGGMPSEPGEPAMVLAESKRLRQMGWWPTRSLEAALTETVDWWRQRS